ncbi:coiled-coil domain-containing protein 40-like isoform X2 [Rhodnius prolixus]
MSVETSAAEGPISSDDELEDHKFEPFYDYVDREIAKASVEENVEGEEDESIKNIKTVPDLIRKITRKLKIHLPSAPKFEVPKFLGPRIVRDLLPGLEEYLFTDENSGEAISVGSSDMLVTTEEFSRDVAAPSPVPEVPHGEYDVLEADNPMLNRFQNVLKEHLVRQKNRLLDQISDLDSDWKATKENIKKVCETIASELKIIKQQQENINNYKKNMTTVNQDLKKVEQVIDDQRTESKQLKTELTEKKKNLHSLEQEREMYVQLLNKMESYKEFQDEQLKMNKIQTAKNKAEIKQMLEEKQKQDLILWRITQIILQLRRNFEASEKNIFTIRQTAEQVENNVTTAEVDIESFKLENVLIRQTVNKNFEIVNAKNQAFPIEKQNLQYAKDTLIELIHQIRGLNKSFHDMQKTEEQSRLRFNKAWMKTTQIKKNMETLSSSISIAENMFIQFQTMFENNEKRLETVKKETRNLENENKKIIKKLNDELSKQNEIKKVLLNKLNENNMTEIFKNRIDKQIKKLAQDAREQEIIMAEVENKLARSLLDNEMLKGPMLDLKKSILQKQKIIDDKESSLKALEKEIRETRYTCRTFQTKIEVKKQTIEELTKKHEQKKAYKSPLEKKAMYLEEELKTLQTDSENIENDWLKLQNDILTKADFRNKLISEVLKLRKDYSRIEQFRIRGEEKVAELQFSERKCCKELEYAHKKLEKIESETVEKSKLRDQLEKLAYIHEKKYEQDLKVAENEYLEMQKQNKELHETIEEMSKNIRALQREFLEWDKKLRLAQREREKFQKEMESNGEIGAMKLEIHRMEVRLSQLKKVQEKMMADLEHCVTRRDNIIASAEARETRFRAGGKQFAKIHLEKKQSDMKMKLKQVKQTSQTLGKDIHEGNEKELQLIEEYDDLTKQVEVLKNGLKEIEMQIHEGQIHKHACLEMTVLRQRKAKLLEDFKFGRYKSIHKSENTLLLEEEKQASIHCALEEVLDALKMDFPQLGLQIVQIINSLKLLE